MHINMLLFKDVQNAYTLFSSLDILPIEKLLIALQKFCSLLKMNTVCAQAVS